MPETPPIRGVGNVLIVGALAALSSCANCSNVKDGGGGGLPPATEGAGPGVASGVELGEDCTMFGRGKDKRRREESEADDEGVDDDDVESGVSARAIRAFE